MTDIPLEQPKEEDIFSLGFDKNLNRTLGVNSSKTAYDIFEDSAQPQNLVSGNYLSLQSSNFISGRRGWKLDPGGNAELGGLFFNRQVVITFFESLDGWGTAVTGSGIVAAALGGGQISTGSTISSTATIIDDALGAANKVKYATKNPSFEAYVSTSSTTNQTIYFSVGDLRPGEGVNEGFGFKIVNNTLSALSSKAGTETLVTISGITITDNNRYQAIMNSDLSSIKYYVNGNFVTTITTNIPNTDMLSLMTFYITNSAAAVKALSIRSAIFAQDL